MASAKNVIDVENIMTNVQVQNVLMIIKLKVLRYLLHMVLI